MAQVKMLLAGGPEDGRIFEPPRFTLEWKISKPKRPVSAADDIEDLMSIDASTGLYRYCGRFSTPLDVGPSKSLPVLEWMGWQ